MTINITQHTSRLLSHLSSGALALSLTSTALAQGTTAVTYQGRLTDGVNPATGIYDLGFTLYDSADGAGTVGDPVPKLGVGVTNGLFTVALDFGAGLFNGSSRWLEIAARTNGAATYVTLAPRQPLTPTPYALYAAAAGSVPAAGLTGTLPDTLLSTNVALLDSSPTFSGTVRAAQFQGNGAELTSLNPTNLAAGNVSTAVNFLSPSGVGIGMSTPGFPLNFATKTGDKISLYGTGPNHYGFGIQAALLQIHGAAANADIAFGYGSSTNFTEQMRIKGNGNVGIGTATPAWPLDVRAGEAVGRFLSTSSNSVSFLELGNTVASALWLGAINFSSSDTTPGQISYTTNSGLTFRVGGSERLRITPEGNVGIGTNDPAGAALSVAGTVRAPQFQGSGASLTGLNAAQVTTGTLPDSQLPASVARTNQVWLLGGNVGTTAGTQFLGTTDNQPLELRVNNQRGLRLEPTGNNDTVNVIGGSARNSVGAGAVGATIGGGVLNTIQPNTGYATIGGGFLNTVQTNAGRATIGGGYQNTIETNAYYATISGGSGNTIQPSASNATIGGGFGNTIQPNAHEATISGGSGNTIQTNATYATIGGGFANTIQTNATYATIGGGLRNTTQTNATCATIPGGLSNEATNYAFAAGYNAHALHTGAFVWSDGSGTETVSTNANSVTFRARGGYRLFSSSVTSGVFLAAGSGTWTAMSDRNAKENFEAVNPREVLDKVAALPVSRWNYKTQLASVRHVGPMAQDFQAAFAVGESDTGITTVDADGVALAAIQGLNQKVEFENQSVRSALEAKDAKIAELEQRLAALEQFIKHQTK